MRTRLKRGQVRVDYDDGTSYTSQGQIWVRETVTTSDVEYSDGRRKPYPLHSVEVHVIVKDEAHDVMEGKHEG